MVRTETATAPRMPQGELSGPGGAPEAPQRHLARLLPVLAMLTPVPLLASAFWFALAPAGGSPDPTPVFLAVGLVGLAWLIGANHALDLRGQGTAAAQAETAMLREALSRAEAECDRLAGQCAALEHDLLFDPLTGARNRRGLETAFTAAGPGTVMALLDIDHFKKINDTFGHDTGDRVLKDFTRLLRTRLHKDQEIFRVGGEEFVVFFPAAAPGDVAALLDRFRRDLQVDVFTRLSDPVTVSFSAGLATLSGSRTSFSAVFKSADTRLYNAKMAGRARTVYDDADMREQAVAAG